MKPTVDFDWDAFYREMSEIPKGNHRNGLYEKLDGVQKKALVAGLDATSNKKAFYDWWKKQGWPGGPTALKKVYLRLKKEEGTS